MKSTIKYIQAIIPHSQFGAPDCYGCLFGRIIGKHAGIICDECRKIIQMVPPEDLQHIFG